MTYEQLQEAGRAMEAKEVFDCLRALSKDPRFAAVVASIERIQQDTADVSCKPEYAANHGTLEHAAGVRFGLMLLAGRLRAAAVAPNAKRGMKRQSENPDEG